MDDNRIDSHKLMYHPETVADWLIGENIGPVYAEIALAGHCNHRCIFCAFDYAGYVKRLQEPVDLFLENLKQAAEKGLKAVMFGGEGEPLLHPDVTEMCRTARSFGLDVAITTNASLLTEKLAGDLLLHLTWLKASINGGMAHTYAQVHGVKQDEFLRVLKNLEAAVKRKPKRCTIGAQMVVLPENRYDVRILARRLADIGVDYLVLKPYSQHPMSLKQRETTPLPYFHSDKIKVIFRERAAISLQQEKRYQRCYGLPFWTYWDAAGNVWGCSCFMGDERFLYGNIYESSFRQIWDSPVRQEKLAWIENEMDVSECRKACRLDAINQYLWEVRWPELVPHVNFI